MMWRKHTEVLLRDLLLLRSLSLRVMLLYLADSVWLGPVCSGLV